MTPLATTPQPLDLGNPPSWATEWGEDRHGVFVALTVGSVPHRLRWIQPGRFLMGSPEDEAGRWDDESPQHEVTLTQGFWLGETPCTRALWQAVQGENPSRFQRAENPVERVSWQDCQEFFKSLESRIPGLAARLPTEAEWEYACRAGTETPTYAEKGVKTEEIAWFERTSGGRTQPVGLKLPNPWGLYDMLGNVWEWCADVWSEYSAEAVEDPVVPAVGSRRVIRGGSWDGTARDVRAAARDWFDPGYRDGYVGFRLARGQTAPG